MTSASRPGTMLSGGGTRPCVQSSHQQMWIYTYHNVKYSPSFMFSPSSLIFHHIYCIRGRFDVWRPHVPTCLAAPVLSLTFYTQWWLQSWDLTITDSSPPIKFRPGLLKYTLRSQEIGFPVNVISNFHFKSFNKNFVYLFGGMRTDRGRFCLV